MCAKKDHKYFRRVCLCLLSCALFGMVDAQFFGVKATDSSCFSKRRCTYSNMSANPFLSEILTTQPITSQMFTSPIRTLPAGVDLSHYSNMARWDTTISDDVLHQIVSGTFPDGILTASFSQNLGSKYGLVTMLINTNSKDSFWGNGTYVNHGGGLVTRKIREQRLSQPTLFKGYAKTFYHSFFKKIDTNHILLSVFVQFVEPAKKEVLGVLQPMKSPFLKIHGNFAYTFDYRSRLDTPFAATNLQQHTEQVYMDAVIKDRYPIRIVLNSRQSNSPFFKNYTDINIQFNGYGFKQNLKNELIDAFTKRLIEQKNPARYEMLVAEQQLVYENAKKWVQSTMRTQEIVAEKETLYTQFKSIENEEDQVKQALKRAQDNDGVASLMELYRQSLAKKVLEEQHVLDHITDSVIRAKNAKLRSDTLIKKLTIAREKKLIVIKDSIDKILDSTKTLQYELRRGVANSLVLIKEKLHALKDSALARIALPGDAEKMFIAKKNELDSLYNNIILAQHRVDSIKIIIQTQIATFASSVQNARSANEINLLAKSVGISGLNALDKNLSAITQLGVGRSTVNYSDLTVNNISLSGVNIEYNPSFYLAFALGSVDYLFRDFVVRPSQLPKQNLVLARLGWGDKESRFIILSSYTGTKNIFRAISNNSLLIQPAANNIHIFGYSIEARYKVDNHTDFSFEAAKSSSPYTQINDRSKSVSRAFTFTDRSNEAWSAKFNKSFPQSQSNLNIFYRQVGPGFQSYSLFTNGSRQEAWGVKWKQYLFNKRLSVTAQIRKNGFENPLVANTYNSSLIFKSIQTILRVKKWPVVSLGYMPGSQLTKNRDGTLNENLYQTLTANLFYNYTFSRKRMTSSLLYTRFYNHGTDTGFVYYNVKNIMINHSIDFGGWHSQTDLQYSAQPNLTYWTVQQRIDLQVGKNVNAGVGARNYRLVNAGTYWGIQMQVNLQMPKIGSLQLQYDKGYLPNGLQELVPNDWGRLSWVRVF